MLARGGAQRAHAVQERRRQHESDQHPDRVSKPCIFSCTTFQFSASLKPAYASAQHTATSPRR